MSTYAETANSFYLEPRRLVAGFMIATTLMLVAAQCDNGNQAGGPKSPLDTNGTKGSGYTPPGGWDGWYQPKGMAPGSYTELPDDGSSIKSLTSESLPANALSLPGDIMGTTTISFGVLGGEVNHTIPVAEATYTEA
jgi:hypothetical protein